MKDLYSFDVDEEALNISYQKMVEAYHNIYARCGLPAVLVEADSGAIGGKESGEFMLLTESGEDLIVYCENCGYAANLEKAKSVKTEYKVDKELELEEISTPGIKTIEEVCGFTGVSNNQTLKAVFYSADGELVFAIIRGDIDVNEIKLKNILKCGELELATDSEVDKAGIVAGAASPINLKGIRIVADESIGMGGNYVAGANKPDTHIKNVNYPRDFKVDIMADIATVSPEDKCIKCGNILKFQRGIEVGHVFKLGTFLSERLNADYLDKDGVSRPIVMGCYGIGLGRLMAAAVEQNHDDKGIIWPVAIAPFQIHLCPLRLEDESVSDMAERIYRELISAGYEVLFDDRNESAGIKFNDADLLGIPIRLTISPKTIQKQIVELKLRKDKDMIIVPVEEYKEKIGQLLS
jgi:prolyl-tRNA synthetase